MNRIDIRIPATEKQMLTDLAKANNITMTELIVSAVKEKYGNEQSVYPGYLDLIESTNLLIQQFEAIRDNSDEIDKEGNVIKEFVPEPYEQDMYNILNVVNQLLIRSHKVQHDKDLQVYIDDSHPTWEWSEDKKPYWRSKFAYSSIDEKELKEIMDR